ncbi:MAG: zinc ribbon domain-containing protein [Thermoplasmata archaeon]
MTAGLRLALTARAPSYRSGDQRAFGPDEDPFTLLVAAWETSFDRFPAGSEDPALPVDLLGPAPAIAPEGLRAIAPVPVEVHPDPTGAWSDAIERALAGPPRVVAGTLPGTSPSSPPLGIVLSVLPGADGDPSGEPAGVHAADGAVVSTIVAAEGPGPRSEADLRRLVPPLPPPAGSVDPSVRDRLDGSVRTAVSEGAYIPWDRYRETLPSRWGLLAERCGRCGRLSFPARGRCRSCGATSAELHPQRLPRSGGVVLAATRVHRGGQPTEFDPIAAETGGYGVVLVELAEGVRATFATTDEPAGRPITIGDRVATVLRRLYPMEGEWRYGRKAVPWPVSRAEPPPGQANPGRSRSADVAPDRFP